VHYVVDPYPCERTLLVCDLGFVAFTCRLPPFGSIPAAAVKASLLRLIDLIRRRKIRFDLVASDPIHHALRGYLDGLWSEKTFVGARMTLDSRGFMGWVTSGPAEGQMDRELSVVRTAVLGNAMKHAWHGLDQEAVLKLLNRIVDTPSAIGTAPAFKQSFRSISEGLIKGYVTSLKHSHPGHIPPDQLEEVLLKETQTFLDGLHRLRRDGNGMTEPRRFSADDHLTDGT